MLVTLPVNRVINEIAFELKLVNLKNKDMATKLLTTLLLITGLLAFGQNTDSQKSDLRDFELVEVVIWEADAKSGGKFIGVAPNEYEAEIAIDELRYLKEGTKYHIQGHKINAMPVLMNKNTSIKDDFISEDDYLEFKYISEIELIALEYMEKNDIKTAVSFYKNVNREKNSDILTRRLKNLQSNYSKYLFEYESAATIVTLSE